MKIAIRIGTRKIIPPNVTALLAFKCVNRERERKRGREGKRQNVSSKLAFKRGGQINGAYFLLVNRTLINESRRRVKEAQAYTYINDHVCDLAPSRSFIVTLRLLLANEYK